jgi:hypothetical protein
MNQNPISELRRRLLEDMAVHKFSEATQRNYIHHIAELAKTVSRHGNRGGRTPLPVHMTQRGARPPKLNSATSAMRFFLGTTLDRPELARHLARVHYSRPLPRVLSPRSTIAMGRYPKPQGREWDGAASRVRNAPNNRRIRCGAEDAHVPTAVSKRNNVRLREVCSS